MPRALRGDHVVRIVRDVPYAPEAIFDLVADVESYPRFVPWCRRTRVLRRDGNRLRVYNDFGRGPIHLTFHTIADLDRPHGLTVRSNEYPFVFFLLAWEFQPSDIVEGTRYVFTLGQQFRSAILETAYGILFNEVAHAVASAFERRAAQLYGQRSR